MIQFGCQIVLASRVTRLVEFSQLGRVFTLGIFFGKLQKKLRLSSSLFRRYRCVLILKKMHWARFLGEFFAQASGHTAGEQEVVRWVGSTNCFISSWNVWTADAERDRENNFLPKLWGRVTG
jgi:hypothetical protein